MEDLQKQIAALEARAAKADESIAAIVNTVQPVINEHIALKHIVTAVVQIMAITGKSRLPEQIAIFEQVMSHAEIHPDGQRLVDAILQSMKDHLPR